MRMSPDLMGGCDRLAWKETVEYSWENGYGIDGTGMMLLMLGSVEDLVGN